MHLDLSAFDIVSRTDDPVTFALDRVNEIASSRVYEMTMTGFKTATIYDRSKLADAAQNNRGILITSRETGTEYGLYLKADSLRRDSVNATIVRIAGGNLDQNHYRLVHCINSEGHIEVRPGWN